MSRSNQNSSAKKSKLSSNKKQDKRGTQSSITKNKLIQFFMKTAQLQRKLQIIKQMLCQEEQFTPASLFNRIDAARKGFITERDIEQYLIDNKIPHKGSQLKTLFGRINSNQSEAGVNLRQFQNFILPNQNPRLRYFTMRRPIYIPLQHQKLNQKIQWITCKFFTQIIKQYTNLMQYNTALISSFDFDAYNVFDVIGAGKQTINTEQISGFMAQNNIQISLQQVGCIVKLIDRKGEGRIHLDDFKLYLATLGLKKQHQIFDQLSPIPLLKNFSEEVKLNLKDRDKCLKDRYLDNKSYVVREDQNRLSRSRKNYS